MSGMGVRAALVSLFGLGIWALGGCNEGGPLLELAYLRPAKFEVPSSVKRLAVAEFVCKESNDAGWGGMAPRIPGMMAPSDSNGAWGSVASDKLSAALDNCNREFKRYELVDRQNLAKILNEQDIALAIKNSADAERAGKVANIHAIIYGNIVVKSSDQMAQKMVFNAMAMTMMPKYYTKRYVYVSVSLTMDDVDTSKTLMTRTVTKEFDSDKDNQGLASVLGFSSDNPEPVGQTVNKVLDACVQEFVQEISPHRLHVQERLEIGKSKLVERGNALATAREYAEALEYYKKALDESSDDGAAFNAGLMCEAIGELPKADEYYTKAFAMNAKEKYVMARKRVRDEAEMKRPSKVEPSAIRPN